MKKKIVLLEFADEAESFLSWCKNIASSPQDFLIIAFQPEVQIFLKQRNISYENTLPYFPNSSHEKMMLKSEELCSFLSKRISILDGSEILESYNNTFLFYFRTYLHHFLTYVEIISNIVSKYDNISLHTCLFENEFHSHTQPYLQTDERFLGLMAREFAAEKGIIWREIPFISKSSANKRSFFNGTKRKFQKITSLFYKIFVLRPLIKDKKVILLTSTGYNLEILSEQLKTQLPETLWFAVSRDPPSMSLFKFFYFRVLKLLGKTKGCSIIPISTESFRGEKSTTLDSEKKLKLSLKKAQSTLKQNPNVFNFHGVNFNSLFSEKIEKDLTPYIISLYSDSISIKNILKDFNVKMSISPFARETSLLISELCGINGIPTLMISHGTLKVPENAVEEIEYAHMGESLTLSKNFKYVAIPTPNEEKVCTRFNRKNCIKTGPLIFSKPDFNRLSELKNSILGPVKKNTRILLYPENTKKRHVLKFQVFETFDEFLSSATDIVHAVNEIENVHLVIRLHPGRKIAPDQFKLLLPKSRKLTVISYERAFYEVLTISDLVISYSSTAIEDALQSFIPVLLYDRHKRYFHLNGEILGDALENHLSPVYNINDKNNLKKGIEWILNNHLNKDISKEIFSNYVYMEDYFPNFIKFFDDKIS